VISQNTNTNHNWSRSRRLDTHLVSVSIILHDEISSEEYSTQSTFIPRHEISINNYEFFFKFTNFFPNNEDKIYATKQWETYNLKRGNSDIFQKNSQYIKNDLSDTIRKIESLKEIEDGWAGEDSISPTNSAIGDAITFIASLPHGLPTPSVTPASDGEIIIEWLFEAKKAVLGFEGDGSFSYAMFINGKYRPGAEEGSVLKGQIPVDLLEYIRTME
jgi:hypothetical protein